MDKILLEGNIYVHTLPTYCYGMTLFLTVEMSVWILQIDLLLKLTFNAPCFMMLNRSNEVFKGILAPTAPFRDLEI